MRTLDVPLTTSGLRRLLAVVSVHQTSKIHDVIENLIPGQGNLWEAIDIKERFSDIGP